MKKEIIKIKGVSSPPGPFNHVVKASGFLFFTSQLSIDLGANEILPGSISEQTRKALDNLKFLLESSGGKMDDIVKVVIYLKDIKDFDEMNDVYREYFEPGQEPARVTVQALSPIDSIDIEIEAIAVV
ncbi:MAG: RidA family protein [Candidatus Abyssubacteria bacterium]|nr:RidA family protein [Candidatus Abyssubacteria bacterium]